MNKPLARIDNWSVVGSVVLGGFRDLEPGQRLTGEVLGHTNLPNGIIYTSAIITIDLENGVVETQNTVYELGNINEDYERWSRDHRKPRDDGEIRAA